MRTLVLAPNAREALLVADEALPKGERYSYVPHSRGLQGVGGDVKILISTRWGGGPRVKHTVVDENGKEHLVIRQPMVESLASLRAIYPEIDVQYVST